MITSWCQSALAGMQDDNMLLRTMKKKKQWIVKDDDSTHSGNFEIIGSTGDSLSIQCFKTAVGRSNTSSPYHCHHNYKHQEKAEENVYTPFFIQ
jgi:hypothetical protein